MTGFGRCEVSDENRKIIVEMKAVNHRYCDFNLRMPRKLVFFETAMRNLLKKYVQRGKVDVFITYEDYSESGICLKYNEDLANEYYKQLNTLSQHFNIENDVNVSALSRYPEVFSLQEQTINEEELWKILESAFRGACERFVESRITEGEQLKNDMLIKLESMLNVVNYIEERSPELIREYKEKLQTKVQEMLADSTIDENRILTEVAIFADRTSIDEEIVRLKSHIQNTKDTLMSGGSVGRKLDFVAQEMNREANTVLSKANDLIISNRAIDLKTDIEKIREQIQNIE